MRDGVLICGAYGKGNAGDDAILKAIIAQMRRIDPDMPIYVSRTTRRDEAALSRRLGAMFSTRSRSGRSCGSTKLFVSGGGSLIQDETSTR